MGAPPEGAAGAQHEGAGAAQVGAGVQQADCDPQQFFLQPQRASAVFEQTTSPAEQRSAAVAIFSMILSPGDTSRSARSQTPGSARSRLGWDERAGRRFPRNQPLPDISTRR